MKTQSEKHLFLKTMPTFAIILPMPRSNGRCKFVNCAFLLLGVVNQELVEKVTPIALQAEIRQRSRE